MKAANNFWSIDIEMREAREKNTLWMNLFHLDSLTYQMKCVHFIMQNLFDEISKMSHKLHSNSDRYKEVWSFLFVILRKIRIRWNFKSCLLFK